MPLTRLEHVGTRLFRWRVVLPLVAVLFGIYLGVLHPWLLTWGATAAGAQLALPGDEADPLDLPSRGPSPSTRPPLRSGRGWCRWARTGPASTAAPGWRT